MGRERGKAAVEEMVVMDCEVVWKILNMAKEVAVVVFLAVCGGILWWRVVLTIMVAVSV